jgi:hypothetical protein
LSRWLKGLWVGVDSATFVSFEHEAVMTSMTESMWRREIIAF